MTEKARQENMRRISALLMHTSEEEPLAINYNIGNEDAFGLSENELPMVTSIFQDPVEGIVCLNIDGMDEPLDLSDLPDEAVSATLFHLVEMFGYVPELIG